jgi:hypothetical protein
VRPRADGAQRRAQPGVARPQELSHQVLLNSRLEACECLVF